MTDTSLSILGGIPRRALRLTLALGLAAAPFLATSPAHAQLDGGFGGFDGSMLPMLGDFDDEQDDFNPRAESLGTTPSGDAIIQYDAETNSIIVITDEETNAQISNVVGTLDRPVPQVLIKVLFLEITHTKDLDLGVQASYTTSDGSGPDDVLLTDFGLDAATQGGFYRILNQNLNLTLRALAQDGKLEVLSRPSVLVRNNESATITIGQEIPRITNSRITDDGQTLNSVTYDDIGIILEVLPRITSENLVEMEVYPEISTLTAESVQVSDNFSAPVIAKRSAQTRVVVADGKTVVIGGLMEDNNTESVRKVPVLGDIPLLGALFRRTITGKSKTELLIFLTPHVILNGQALDDATLSEKAKSELMPGALTDVQRSKFLEEPIAPEAK